MPLLCYGRAWRIPVSFTIERPLHSLLLVARHESPISGSAACIELTHRIRKGQFDLAKLGLQDAAAPTEWNAVLSTR
jgi:hypothetical protein